jgi:FlaA1/EpsC-like NDP-sugar epimerase
MKIDKVAEKFVNLSRFQKRALIASTDSILLLAAIWLAFTLRLGELYIPHSNIVFLLFAVIPFIAIPIFTRFGLYRAIIRYIGFRALWAVLQAVTLYAMTWGLLVLLTKAEGVPRSVIIINWIIAVLLIGGTRMVARWWLSGLLSESFPKRTSSKTHVLIYGAGSAGIQLASALSYSNEYKPVAFVDDKSELHNTHVNSLRVYPFKQVGSLIEKFGVQEVLLAVPTASRKRRHYIIQQLQDFPVHVRTLPGMAEIAGGQVKIEDIKEVEIEDLLGRDPVTPYPDLLDSNIRNKVVMVTGAGGSIGSELCKQIIKQQPKCLVLFELNEYALYNIDSELRLFSNNKQIVEPDSIIPVIGSVLDKQRFEQACRTFSVETIYHAAAYKHVPLVEKNPLEAIRNNILGTLTAAQAAIECNVDTFVLISTDKAVRPTNVMGATKRFAELILQGLAATQATTRFCMVRFGNVLGSSGSVVPVFRKQIQEGGPVTVTHPEIIRYFMTIPEAAELVIQAGAMGSGGDVFVLDMGEPVNISELARKMIHLSGLEVKDDNNPDGDIEIEFTGLRPGEKLYEELLIGNNPIGTKHPRIFTAIEESVGWEELQSYIQLLEKSLSTSDCESALTLLLNVVSEYHPQGSIEDLTWKEKRRRKDLDHVVSLKDFRDKHKNEDSDLSNLKSPS